uniref:Alcohol dehydrogenase-like C-terminal domain-containing protein n=1 Tax=Terrapene triunguis TaxID=2587831 RepID=A0A674IEN9_9SAUR
PVESTLVCAHPIVEQSLVPLCLPHCGECCSDLNPDTKPHATQDQQIHHFLWIISTFSEYTVVPDSALARIVAAAPRDKIWLSGCGFSTGYGAAINTAKVKPGSTCAIFSLGGMGLSVVIGCKAARATEWINPQDFKKPFQEVLFEMTGHAALASCHMGSGNCMMIRTHPLDILCLTITYSKCVCSIVHCVRGFLFVFPVSSYMEKKFNPDVLMTHTLPFDKINEGFELLRSAKR